MNEYVSIYNVSNVFRKNIDGGSDTIFWNLVFALCLKLLGILCIRCICYNKSFTMIHLEVVFFKRKWNKKFKKKMFVKYESVSFGNTALDIRKTFHCKLTDRFSLYLVIIFYSIECAMKTVSKNVFIFFIPINRIEFNHFSEHR